MAMRHDRRRTEVWGAGTSRKDMWLSLNTVQWTMFIVQHLGPRSLFCCDIKTWASGHSLKWSWLVVWQRQMRRKHRHRRRVDVTVLQNAVHAVDECSFYNILYNMFSPDRLQAVCVYTVSCNTCISMPNKRRAKEKALWSFWQAAAEFVYLVVLGCLFFIWLFLLGFFFTWLFIAISMHLNAKQKRKLFSHFGKQQ